MSFHQAVLISNQKRTERIDPASPNPEPGLTRTGPGDPSDPPPRGVSATCSARCMSEGKKIHVAMIESIVLEKLRAVERVDCFWLWAHGLSIRV